MSTSFHPRAIRWTLWESEFGLGENLFRLWQTLLGLSRNTDPSCLPHTAGQQGTTAGSTPGKAWTFLRFPRDTSQPRCLDMCSSVYSLKATKYSGQTVPLLVLPSNFFQEPLDHQGQVMPVKDMPSQPYSSQSGTEALFTIPLLRHHQ